MYLKFTYIQICRFCYSKESKESSYSPSSFQSDKPVREKAKAKISLGAAATYGRVETSSTSPPAASAAFEDNSPAADSNANGDFANFSAMRAKAGGNNDDFSDFQSNVPAKTETSTGNDLLGDFTGLTVTQVIFLNS